VYTAIAKLFELTSLRITDKVPNGPITALYHTSTPLKKPDVVPHVPPHPEGVPDDWVAKVVVPLTGLHALDSGLPRDIAVVALSLAGGGGTGLQAICMVPQFKEFTTHGLSQSRIL
jgi:hypothetical protein